MAKHWIANAIKHPGAFTKKAKAAGESVAEFAAQVTKPGSKASTQTKRQANLAQTLRKMHHGKGGDSGMHHEVDPIIGGADCYASHRMGG